ncbi:IclR family transcriptional regulator [Desulfovibrio sp. OttesenSCG-928-C06]|nr:IclR family transcriptional regulator [Desulfovibrio sp. OttesenSCG-928-C06]
MKDQYILNSVANALQILDLLSQQESLGVAEISKALGFGRASVFRLLYTMEKSGYVTKNVHAKYDLAIKFAYYGALVVDRQSMVQASKPVLEKLRDTYNETAHLSMLTSSGKLVFLSKHYSGSSLQMYSRVGEERDSHNTASGKVMLAHIEQERAEALAGGFHYEPLTVHSITCAEQLLQELEQIRQHGYAVDREETEIGLVCFSAPVFDHRGECVAAISLSGPTSRMYGRQDEIIQGVLAASQAISVSLGFGSQRSARRA